DRTEEDLERGEQQIRKSLSKKENVDVENIMKDIMFTTNIEDGEDSDLVIEAVPEKIEIKKEVFTLLDQIMQPKSILASNTSSLSIASISSATMRPEKVIGLHFFSPVPVMRLLE